MDKEQFNEVYRHSMAHILAKAVIEIFGEENVQYAIGPQIDDGFYYDFLLPRPLNQEDFDPIEKKMKEILKRKEDWTRSEIPKEEALERFKGQKYKEELIEELPEGETISIYDTGDDFCDLCRGPHVENSRELLGVAFKIKSASGAYWRGDENRDSLQRIYVYAFPDKGQLKAHLNFIKEAMERDHKKLGNQLDLFMFDPTAPGMPYWLPRGYRLYNALLSFWRDIHEAHGYDEISAPVANSKQLWVTSGHWEHYKHNMFIIPVKKGEDDDPLHYEFGLDEENQPYDVMALKPMNCPNAITVYKRGQKSYRDLPLKYSETDVIHRKEKSGELNGLFRVQQFRQDDAHIFLTEDQIAAEIDDIMDIAGEIYGTFGLTYVPELSTRPEDFMGDIEVWNKAEAELKEILNNKYGEGNYEINEGDGAFYGPKIDLKMKDCIGREWQMGTIQLDFQLPLNFDLKYIDQDGAAKTPVLIHRAIFGSMERFTGILIENFKGMFPFWLSPMQVGIVPIRVSHNDYAKKVEKELRKNHIRVEADYQEKNMKEKIKAYKNMKDPYIIIVGDREAEEGTVSLNIRGSNKQLQNVPLETFIAMCKKMNDEVSLELLEEVPEELKG